MQVAAAALVHEGRVLAGRRPIGWEFPGGKREPGERWPAAVVREVREELWVDVRAVEELGRVIYGTLELRLWLVEPIGPVPILSIAHDELRWLDADHLDEVGWLPADRILLDCVRPLLGTNAG